jgi:molybdopterin biosynthesis enzyme
MGEPLPPGADAVAPEEAMLCRDGIAEALAPLAPGDGVLMPAADAQAGRTLCQAGRRLRAIDRAVLQAAGIRQVAIREPRVRLICAGVPGAAIASAYEWLGRLLADEGAAVIANESGVVANDDPRQARDLAAAFRDERSDAIFVLGGTGAGSTDVSVVTLARLGRVAFHGVALVPGQTAAFGLAGNRPVLFFPGRLDAAVAVWLAIGRRLLAGLAGGRVEEAVIMAQLSRKIASSPGMAEVVPVRRSGNAAEPLASGYLSLSSLARADGWILVPAHSEGFPAGAQVAVSPFA